MPLQDFMDKLSRQKKRLELKLLRVRNKDPRTSYEAALACEESGETENLAHYIPEILRQPYAKHGLTTRQIARHIRIHFNKYYERDSVSPMMRALERLEAIKATNIVRKDQYTKRYVIVWALPKFADKIKPEGEFERWASE